jgi:hypothetical protein
MNTFKKDKYHVMPSFMRFNHMLEWKHPIEEKVFEVLEQDT